MNISGTASVFATGQPIATQNQAADGKGGFMNAFLNAMQLSATANGQAVMAIGAKAEGMAEGELAELIEFLQSSDLLDIEGGINMLDQVMSNANLDLVQMVKNYLGISDEKWTKLIEGLTESQDNGEETKPTQDHQSDLEVLEMLLANMISLPLKEMPNHLTKDFEVLVKAVKLYELLAVQRDSGNIDPQLKVMIKQLTERLEILMPQNKSVNRAEFVQKTFTQLSGELSQAFTTKLDKQVKKEDLLAKSAAKFEMLNGVTLPLQQMAKPEQLTLMLEGARKPVSADQLIEQFESLLSRSTFTKTGGVQRLLIKLNPEHLGSLRIELIQKEQSMVARILTTNGVAKDVLDSHLNGLKQAFAAQNISVDKIEITQQMGQQERFMNRDQSQHEGQQKNDQKQEFEQNQHNGEFTQTFEEVLLNAEV